MPVALVLLCSEDVDGAAHEALTLPILHFLQLVRYPVILGFLLANGTATKLSAEEKIQPSNSELAYMFLTGRRSCPWKLVAAFLVQDAHGFHVFNEAARVQPAEVAKIHDGVVVEGEAGSVRRDPEQWRLEKQVEGLVVLVRGNGVVGLLIAERLGFGNGQTILEYLASWDMFSSVGAFSVLAAAARNEGIGLLDAGDDRLSRHGVEAVGERGVDDQGSGGSHEGSEGSEFHGCRCYWCCRKELRDDRTL